MSGGRGGDSVSRYTGHMKNLLILGTGLGLFAGAFAVYWYGDAGARYVWRQWRQPVLAIALDRGDAALLMAIGNRYYGSTLASEEPLHSPALAKAAFRKALRIEPGILWGHYSLARIAFTEGDFATALAEINAELAANPENLRSLYIRGLIYGYRGRPGDLVLAEFDFTRFTTWAPTEWAGYNDLAWILSKEGKYAEVESTMARALKNVPGAGENPWLWNMLGVARLNQGDRSGAASAFAEALAYTKRLTLADWRRAYSGNDPAGDEAGLAAFVAGIEKNEAAAEGVAPAP